MSEKQTKRKLHIGRFMIGAGSVRDQEHLIRKVFVQLQLIPVHVEMLWHEDALAYTALSPDFEAISEGDEVPTYDILFTKDIKNINLRVQKRKH